MILICRLRNEYWTFWGFLWGAGELGQRYSFDGWRGACGAYLRHRGSNRVTIDVLPGRPMGPLTLLIIGSITMPHTAQHSQKKKHFLHWIIDWENFLLSRSWCEVDEHRALDLVPAKFFLLLCFDLFQPSEMVLIRSLKDDIGVTLMTETGMTLPMMTWHHRCGFGATGCEPGPATDYRNEELFL